MNAIIIPCHARLIWPVRIRWRFARQAEVHDRARGILENGHPAGVQDVERLRDHVTPGLFGHGVDVVDRDVRAPMWRRHRSLLLGLLVDGGDIIPVDPAHLYGWETEDLPAGGATYT